LGLGMRQGELISLRRQDVDLDTGRLRVTRALNRASDGQMFKEPKTERSRRTLDMPASVVAALRVHSDRQQFERQAAGRRWQKTGLVFTTGTALSPRNVGRSFEESIVRAGVPRMRLHDLRHVNASLDLSTGTSVKAVAARLAHSDPSITLRTYAHVMPHEEMAAAERLRALLSTQSS
jgi:integrase